MATPCELSAELQKQIIRGIAVLRQGGVVAFPTETVYGLGACAFNQTAVAKVYRVKVRPRYMALPLLLADTSQISEVAYHIPPVAWLLADKFLPGALTLILAKSSSVPDIVTGSGSTVAVRVPDHPVPVALARDLGPVVGTSANISGKPSPLTAKEVNRQFGDAIDFIIDGGRCPGGTESTVINVTGDKPVILREGAISREEISRVCKVI